MALEGHRSGSLPRVYSLPGSHGVDQREPPRTSEDQPGQPLYIGYRASRSSLRQQLSMGRSAANEGRRCAASPRWGRLKASERERQGRSPTVRDAHFLAATRYRRPGWCCGSLDSNPSDPPIELKRTESSGSERNRPAEITLGGSTCLPAQRRGTKVCAQPMSDWGFRLRTGGWRRFTRLTT